MVRVIYIIFLGALIATFIGVGIAAFYKAPSSPQYPAYPESVAQKGASPSADLQIQREFQQKQDVFMTEMKIYNRNVSIIVLVAAIVILAGSMLFAKHLSLIGDGLLLGSALSLVYSIITGFAANDDTYRFVIVGISLCIVLFIGYMKFVKPQKLH